MIIYLKRLKSSKFVRVKAFPMYGGIGVSAPSLHRESTDSLIHSLGAGDPTLSELVQTLATSVRVAWSHPTEGAPVTGYIVHYTRDDGLSGNESDIGATTMTSEITGLTNDRTYIISVEATAADGLSGESAEMNITLSE